MEPISVLDIFKIGIGPSSSHTMGPWKAALQFVDELKSDFYFDATNQVIVILYGSLALTGKGHATQEALLMGLSGYHPETVPMEIVRTLPAIVKDLNKIILGGSQEIEFHITSDIIFNIDQMLPYHPNGMTFQAYAKDMTLLKESSFYSIGGGFVIKENEQPKQLSKTLPFPIETTKDLKNYCNQKGKGIDWIVKQNEKSWRSQENFEMEVLKIWETMFDTLFKGCFTEGTLPGGLDVKRRAHNLLKDIIGNQSFENKHQWLEFLKKSEYSFEDTLKLVSCFAIATNEENADLGRVVTAPTNGAAGVIPAVLMYYLCKQEDSNSCSGDIINFFCVAGEVGSIFKKNATISAAMGGCQAEIGVSSSMAAAALTYLLDGSVSQVFMAAEIAMEHHLGLTCDPVAGLVQIPCIERNSMGAIKAITSAHLALSSDPAYAKISLDEVINTMWETAQDMSLKYKETSLGGLAINHSVNIPEC